MGRNKKPPSRTVTFNLDKVHDQQYILARNVAELAGRKLSRAEWLNQCVSDALAARAESAADEAAVNVAVANLNQYITRQILKP